MPRSFDGYDVSVDKASLLAGGCDGNSDNANYIDLQAVDQGIRETVESQCPRPVRAGFTQFGKPAQETKRLIDLIREIIRCDERAFADVPIDGGIGIGLCFVAKTDLRWLWRH